jgi:hypothetical protein
MTHSRMVQRWRAGLAEPVSPGILSYVTFDGCWWRRHGGAWESIPDGAFALALSAGHARLAAARRVAGLPPIPRDRDPWTVARNRRRSGGRCGRPASPWPVLAVDLRPVPPVRCRPRRTGA